MEKLSPREKRKLFRERYGALLEPLGFFFFKSIFFRVSMTDGMVWMVSAYFGQYGGMCRICFDALPFELGLTVDRLREGSIFIDGFLVLSEEERREKREHTFIEEFEAVYRRFTGKYLDRLLATRDMESREDLHRWLSGEEFPSGDIHRTWPSIVLGRYGEAVHNGRCLIQFHEKMLVEARQWLARGEEEIARFEAKAHPDMHPSTLAAARRRLALQLKVREGNVQGHMKEIARHAEFLKRLEPPQIAYFEEQVRAAREQSAEACRAYFGKRAR